MRAGITVLAILVAVGLACQDSGSPVPETTPVTPPPGPADGSASCLLNGTKQDIVLYSQRNGYDSSQVVLRGYGEGLENTLMMTFRPVQGTLAQINTQMTGYWDLGLCIPFKKYLLTDDPANFIRVTSYDSGTGLLKGEFTLTFRYEKDPTKVASFTNGTFETKVDSYPFKYCIEG